MGVREVSSEVLTCSTILPSKFLKTALRSFSSCPLNLASDMVGLMVDV